MNQVIINTNQSEFNSLLNFMAKVTAMREDVQDITDESEIVISEEAAMREQGHITDESEFL